MEKKPRKIHNGWKLQKFHDLLHVVSRHVYMFGSPQNWDANPGNDNLIDFAKLFYVYKRRGILYPDYCSMGPWHDWVMVTCAMHGNCVVSQFIRDRHCEKYCFQPGEYPCKTFGFLEYCDNAEVVVCNLMLELGWADLGTEGEDADSDCI